MWASISSDFPTGKTFVSDLLMTVHRSLAVEQCEDLDMTDVGVRCGVFLVLFQRERLDGRRDWGPPKGPAGGSRSSAWDRGGLRGFETLEGGPALGWG